MDENSTYNRFQIAKSLELIPNSKNSNSTKSKPALVAN